MNPKPNPGKAEGGVIQVLPEMSFDFEGKSMSANLGKTEVPLNVLPDLAFDLQALPLLEVTVFLRSEATPAQIGYDLYRLYLALNKLDQNLEGDGLNPRDIDIPYTTGNGSCTLSFRPKRLQGSAQRFVEIANLINTPERTATWLPTPMSGLAGFSAAAGPG